MGLKKWGTAKFDIHKLWTSESVYYFKITTPGCSLLLFFDTGVVLVVMEVDVRTDLLRVDKKLRFSKLKIIKSNRMIYVCNIQYR